MIRRIFYFLIISTLFFTGCTSDNKETKANQNNASLSTSFKKNVDASKSIILSGKTLSYNKYAYIGNLLFFPDTNNNNKLSVAQLSENSVSITKDIIIDSFDYSVDSLASDNTTLYFSSTSKDHGLYKLDYEKKDIVKINNDSPKGIVYQTGKLYYIDLNTNNMYSYDIKSKSKTILSNNKAGNFILNSNNIFYKNLDDNSKLYCLVIDNNNGKDNNLKLTDMPVDSFITYNNEILFINTSDNNSLYSLNLSNKEIKKVLNINASNLKQLENTIYFINNDDPNSIYTITQATQNDKFEYNKLFSDFTNEYFPTEKGIFIEPASNLQEIKILYST
jgi:Domain of unknown function (DUF5050)